LFRELLPLGGREEELTRVIALCFWQLRRVAEVETSLFVFHLFDADCDAALARLTGVGISEQEPTAPARDTRPTSTTRAAAERELQEAQARLASEQALLGRAFLRDASGAEGFGKISRYSRGILGRLVEAQTALRRAQRDRLEPEAEEDNDD
jgi:hypothetical protein